MRRQLDRRAHSVLRGDHAYRDGIGIKMAHQIVWALLNPRAMNFPNQRGDGLNRFFRTTRRSQITRTHETPNAAIERPSEQA